MMANTEITGSLQIQFSLEDQTAFFESQIASQKAKGDPKPLISGNPLSVLNQGPSDMKRPELWNGKTSSTIAHFLDTFESLSRTDWYRGRASVNYTYKSYNGQPEVRELLNARVPGSDSLSAALRQLRLLYEKKDDLFLVTCNLYRTHADDRKNMWIEFEQDHYRSFRDGLPQPDQFRIDNLKVYEILLYLMYGTFAMHRKADEDADAKLAEAVRKYGPDHVIGAYNGLMRTLLVFPALCYPVIKQDYNHWIGKLGAEGQSHVSLKMLHGEK
jgi:hypothetical protein